MPTSSKLLTPFEDKCLHWPSNISTSCPGRKEPGVKRRSWHLPCPRCSARADHGILWTGGRKMAQSVDCEIQKSLGFAFCSLRKHAWGSRPDQSLEAREQDSPDPCLHGPLPIPEGVKAHVNQRIAGRVRHFEGDKQGQPGELLLWSSQEGLSEEAAFHLRPKRKKEASHLRRGRTLQEQKSSLSPGWGGVST